MTDKGLFRLSGQGALMSGGLLVIASILAFFAESTLISAGFFLAHLLLVFAFMGIYLWHRNESGKLGLWAFILLTLSNVLFVALQGMDAFIIPGLLGTWLIGAIELATPVLPAAIPFVVGAFALGLLLQALSFQQSKRFPLWAGWLAFVAMLLNLINGLAGLGSILGLIAPLAMGVAILGLGNELRKD